MRLQVMDKKNKNLEMVATKEMAESVADRVPGDVPKKSIFGSMRGSVDIVGDIVTSAVPAEDWESLI